MDTGSEDMGSGIDFCLSTSVCVGRVPKQS